MTKDGKTKKAQHLDWHFRTNQRLVDSAKRAQSRSWYVDELVSRAPMSLSTSSLTVLVRIGSDRERTRKGKMDPLLRGKIPKHWWLQLQRRMIPRPSSYLLLVIVLWLVFHALYARRSSTHRGTMKCRILFGWTLNRLGLEYTMLVATPNYRKMELTHREPRLQIRYSGREKQRSVCEQRNQHVKLT